jgi:endo-1,4-beta-xylanase
VAGAAPADLPAVMADFAALDVDVAVTELDLRIRLPADKQSLLMQAADYGSVVRACRETPRCVGVTTWGITDDRSWIPSFFSGYGAALPFDEHYRPKPAVAAIIGGFTEKAP